MKSFGTNGSFRHSLRTAVPVAPNSFVGRRREAAEVTHLPASARLVTVTGAGGRGKTRLARQTAGALGGQFADGACWVELGRLTDPAPVPAAVAKAANVAEQPDQGLADQLLDDFHGKQLLLVLDSCEHLAGACARLVDKSSNGSSRSTGNSPTVPC